MCSDAREQDEAHHREVALVFKTPLSFTIPSFLSGAAMSFDVGGSIRDRMYRYMSEDPHEADRIALLGDFVVLGDDMIEAMDAYDSAHPEELEPSSDLGDRLQDHESHERCAELDTD